METPPLTTLISVNITSIICVTLISGPPAPLPAIENDIESSSASLLARACLQHQTPGAAGEFPALPSCYSEERSDEESAVCRVAARPKIPRFARNDNLLVQALLRVPGNTVHDGTTVARRMKGGPGKSI